MANVVARLVALLGLDASEYTRGLNKAEVQAQQFARNTASAIASVAKVIGALGIGAIIVENAKAIVQEAAALNDLSDATGSTVEALSRLNNQARVAGADFQQMENALLKLSLGMSGTDEEANRTQKALKILGITTKDPAEAMTQAAVKLNQYADGINKLGLAAALFGDKLGPKFVASLKDIAEAQDVGATITKEQAAAAEELGKQYRRLSVDAEGFKNALLSFVVPALTEMLTKMRETIQAAGGFWAALRFGAETSPFDTPAEGAARLSKRILEIQDAIGKLNERQLGSRFGIALTAELETKQRQLTVFNNLLQLSIDKATEAAHAGLPKPPAPPPPPKGKGATDQTAKRLLEQDLKVFEQMIKAEQQTLNDRTQFLDAYYRNDLIGFRDYFADRRRFLEEAGAGETAALDKQIERLRKFAAAPTTKADDRIKAETDIATAMERRLRIQQDIATKTVLSVLEENRALQQFKDSIEQTAIELAKMRGDTVVAAEAAFDFAHRKMQTDIKQLAQSAAPEDQRLAALAQKGLDESKKLTSQRAQLTKATEDYALSLGDLALKQEQIQLLEATGAITTNEAIARRAALNAQYVESLNAELVALEAIARASGRREDIAAVAQKRFDLQKLANEQLIKDMEALKRIQEQIFDLGANALTDFITGTKNAKDAMKSFLNDLNRFLINQAFQGIKGAVIGGAGTGTDIFSLLFKLWGGSIGTPPMFPSWGGGGGLNLSSYGPAFAATGGVARGGWTMVGESGPELVDLPAGARIKPNNQIRYETAGGGTVVVNQYIDRNADTRAHRQAALDAFNGAAGAARRR